MNNTKNTTEERPEKNHTKHKINLLHVPGTILLTLQCRHRRNSLEIKENEYFNTTATGFLQSALRFLSWACLLSPPSCVPPPYISLAAHLQFTSWLEGTTATLPSSLSRCSHAYPQNAQSSFQKEATHITGPWMESPLDIVFLTTENRRQCIQNRNTEWVIKCHTSSRVEDAAVTRNTGLLNSKTPTKIILNWIKGKQEVKL